MLSCMETSAWPGLCTRSQCPYHPKQNEITCTANSEECSVISTLSKADLRPQHALLLQPLLAKSLHDFGAIFNCKVKFLFLCSKATLVPMKEVTNLATHLWIAPLLMQSNPLDWLWCVGLIHYNYCVFRNNGYCRGLVIAGLSPQSYK